jgi:NAD+ kinase
MDAPPRAGTVALYVDLFRLPARTAAAAFAQAIRSAGFAVALCEDQDRELGLASSGAVLQDADLLVTIGGDGTLLRAAQIAAPYGIPLFGINTGRLGFLTEMDAAGAVEALPQILLAGFVIDERAALNAGVHGKLFFALNDIVVKRTSPRMAPFLLVVDGKEAAHVPADGVVVATPTGSTAYSLSAGGPVIAPDVDAFIVTALLPHTLFSRPLVVPTSSTIVIACDPETPGVDLEADGQVVARLDPGERVTVTRAPQNVLFARRAPLDFFAVLEGKLRWNAPVKDR